MSAVTRIGASAFDKAIYRGAPEKTLDDMTDEELDAEFLVSEERLRLARWGGRILGAVGGVATVGAVKLVGIVGKAAPIVAAAL
jgi:hypothetical protein